MYGILPVKILPPKWKKKKKKQEQKKKKKNEKKQNKTKERKRKKKQTNNKACKIFKNAKIPHQSVLRESCVAKSLTKVIDYSNPVIQENI